MVLLPLEEVGDKWECVVMWGRLMRFRSGHGRGGDRCVGW